MKFIFTQLSAGSDPTDAPGVAGDAGQDCPAAGQRPRVVATHGSHGCWIQTGSQHPVKELFVRIVAQDDCVGEEYYQGKLLHWV